MNIEHRLVVLLVSSALAACGHGSGTPATAWLVVDGALASDVDLSRAHVDGASVRSIVLSGSKLAVEIDATRGSNVTVRAEGACPVTLSKEETLAGRTAQRRLAPWIDFGGTPAAVGFGGVLKLTASPGCPEAAVGTVAWKQMNGSTLHDVHVDQNGYHFTATMPSLAEALGGTPPWGIIPISPRTRGDVELQATWSNGETTVTRIVHASAAARSHGLPNVALGARLYLGGEGWHLLSTPPGSHTALDTTGGAASLLPDARGSFTLADDTGHTLRLVAGKYDETPLDCGRSDCHAGIATAALSNPMTTILERGLAAPFPGDYPGCALGCHAVGEPGLHDGGFVAIAAALGMTPADVARTGFHDLPPSLRRLGGVGCLGCHGPGAIPEASGRFAILRADVCATCHDAPPRYGHVAAWRLSRMARSDADPRTRDGACARCHTTWGFLGRSDWRPPAELQLNPVELIEKDKSGQSTRAGTAVGAFGIACAACHAVHPTRADANVVLGKQCAEALRRDLPVPALLTTAVPATAMRGEICLTCHSPDDSTGTPLATAAALWAARGGLDPVSGAALVGPTPHIAVNGGCIGCHKTGPAEFSNGAGHAFQARRDGCATGCHTEKSSTASSLRARAVALWQRLVPAATPLVGTEPVHAGKVVLNRATRLGRAAWDVAMVLEDPAADAHNAPYARALLDAADQATTTGGAR